MLTPVGNLSTPNTFSYNLLKNLRDLAGVYPVIRVGGNTQYVINQSSCSVTGFMILTS